jgi:hypothetical protein
MTHDTLTLTTTTGTTVDVSTDAVVGADLSDPGYCLRCGAERGGCEPDAREYPCDACGECLVYGAQELLMMGHIA